MAPSQLKSTQKANIDSYYLQVFNLYVPKWQKALTARCRRFSESSSQKIEIHLSVQHNTYY